MRERPVVATVEGRVVVHPPFVLRRSCMGEGWEKYGLGVVLPLVVSALAVLFIYWGVAYVPRLPYLPGRTRITGQTALFINLAYVALAGFMFGHFFLQRNAKTLEAELIAYVLQVVTLVLFIAIFFLTASGLVLPGL